MQNQTLAEQRQLHLAAIEKYLASGLLQKRFCQQAQLAYSTFQVWLKKYRHAQAEPTLEQHSDNSFVPLTFTPIIAKVESALCNIEYCNGVVLSVWDNEKKDSCHLGYMWVYHAPLDGWVLFDYRQGRGPAPQMSCCKIFLRICKPITLKTE